jgi:PAS domain S-box-containing protein
VKQALGEPTRLLAVNSKDVRTRDIAQQLTQKIGNFRTLQTSQQLSLVSNHKRQFVRVIPYRDNYGLDWLVVVIVPESDFMEKIHAHTRTTILLCISALVGSIGVGMLTANWITKPILRLNTAAKQIAKGQWDEPIELERADEVGELATSFNQMAAYLQQSFAELNSLNTALVQNESRLNQILEALPVGVSVHDSTGKVIYVNQIAKQLLRIETIPEAETEQLAEVYQVYQAGTEHLYRAKNLPVVRSLQGERVRVEDMEIRFSDSRVPLEVYSTPLFDETGNIAAAIATFFDITERKQAEQLLADYNRTLETEVAQKTEVLRRSEALLNEAQRVAKIGSWSWNLVSDERWWSPQMYQITGLNPEEYPVPPDVETVNQSIHQEDRERVNQITYNAIEQGISYEIEFRYLRPNGSITYAFSRGLVERDSEGRVTRFWGISQDISDKKQAELALLASQRRYQTLTEASPVCIFHTDAAGNCIYVNQRWSEITGLSLEEAHESGWAKTLHPDDRDRVFADWYAAAAAQVPFKSEYRFVRPDGQITWVIGQALPELGNDGEIIGYVGTITDISNRKQIEQELRQLSTALENAVEGISRLDTQGRYVAVNKAYADITGYQIEEMIGMEWPRTVHPHDVENMIAAYQEMLEVGKVEAQAKGIRKDGSMFYKQLVMITAYDEQHNFIGHYCFMKDISDKKQAEEALQHQLAVIEAATNGIAILNDNSEYTYLNQAHATLFGYSNANELIGKTWKELYYPEEISRFERDVFPLLMQQGHWQGEAIGKKQDGTTFAEEISLTLIEGKGLICVCQDITKRKLAELALQQQKEILQTIFDNLPVMLCFYDANVQIQLVNPAFEQTLGWSLAELQEGIDLMAECYPDPDYRASVLEFMMRTDGTWRDFQLRTRTGQILETTWANVRLSNNATVGIGQDITDRKRAEQSLREIAQREKAIATVIQRMRETLDIDTIFRSTTEELRGVMKCDRVVVFQFDSNWSGQFVAESVGNGWISLIQQQTNNPQANEKLVNDSHCAVRATMLRGTSVSITDSYLQQTKGGAYNQSTSYRVTKDIYQSGFSSCYIQLLEELQIRAYIIVPISCGNQLWGLLATYQNSNSRNWSEAEINTVVQIGIQLGVALQQAQLLQQTQQQAIQLQHAAYAAEAANRAKSQFLANMSHELRTPLNGILGYAQILQADKNCTPKQQKGVGIIHQCGTHLLTLINDILDLSKIEAGKIELYPEDFHLPSLLTSLSEIFQMKATQKSITFTYLPANQLPKLIHTDEKRLRQVFMNLLSNAIKFTDSGSVTFKVEVIGNGSSVIGNREQDQLPITHYPLPITHYPLPITKIRFQVEDTGIGIPSEHLEKIFLPFEQVGDSSRRAEGTGLGLAITQKIVELMGSQLFVESTPGVGSKFWFDLDVPVVSTPMKTITVESSETIISYSGSKRKILIVDDYWENLTVLINILEPIGFELEQAVDGQEGLEKAVECQPDLILVDLVMPVMDGYQMTRRLRQLSEFQDTIIIAISANVFESDRLRSQDAGCNDFLPKPLRAEDLLAKIKLYLNLSWIYDNESNAQSQTLGDELSCYPQVEPTEMVIPPKEELLVLYEATNTGHVNGVKEEALRLQQLNPDYSPFATRILELAADFEYEEIANLIDPYLS